jgi:hypothetical protein
LTKAILCAFEAESGKLYKLPVKAQKVIAYLNDSSFWFGYHIIKVTDIKIFKHTMKFLELYDGIVAHKLHFHIIKLQNLILNLKENVENYFEEAL